MERIDPDQKNGKPSIPAPVASADANSADASGIFSASQWLSQAMALWIAGGDQASQPARLDHTQVRLAP
jgi:cyanophycinase-like exopeptidase